MFKGCSVPLFDARAREEYQVELLGLIRVRDKVRVRVGVRVGSRAGARARARARARASIGSWG